MSDAIKYMVAVEGLWAETQATENSIYVPFLDGVEPEVAFRLGYETALRDVIDQTMGDQLEVGVITFTPKEEDDA